MKSAITISEATESDESAWDAFVESCDEASIFHRYAWRAIINDAYGHSSRYLLAKRGETIVGVLPLIDVRSPLLGRALISTAFTVGGGVASVEPTAARLLADHARMIGREMRVRYVELRGESFGLDDWATKDSVYAGFEKPIPATADAILKGLPRRRRAEVRKGLDALKAGVVSYEFNRDCDTFYALYARAMRDHGTPIFPRRFPESVLKAFGGQAEILVVRAEGRPVIALLTLNFKERVMPYYFGANMEAARAHRAYDLAIYLQMVRGAEHGRRLFDFGRSKFGSGSFDYKSFWGFEPRPLRYYYALVQAQHMPNINPMNPKFSRVSEVWKKMPLPLANFVGPLVAGHFA